MKVVSKGEAASFSNGPTCDGVEYPFSDKQLNISVVKVNGRYPEHGYALNEIIKEAGYVVSGTGSITVNDQTVALAPGDAVLIQPGEKYYWQGDMLELFMPCSPAFSPEQHKHVESL